MNQIQFLPTEEYVKVLGRSVMLEDCRLLSLSGSGVEFAYTGTELTVEFFGDSSTEGEGAQEPWRDQARVQVIVDGRVQLDTVIRKPHEVYAVWGQGQTEAAEHIVRIVKLSEPRMSTIGLGQITILAEGPAVPTPAKEKLIGFIGDSITCGYGIDAESEWVGFSTTTENVTKAYSYRTIQALDMDYSIVSYSGHGLISGYTADPNTPLLEELVPPYYEIFAYSFNSFRGQKLQDIPWDFASHREPNIIVINLGTNDDSYVQGDATKEASFVKAYVEFLGQVHRCNPNATIVSAFGLMGDALYLAEVRAVEEFKAQSGFDRVYNCHLTPQDGEKMGYGSDWHPSAATHERAAQELVDFIRAI